VVWKLRGINKPLFIIRCLPEASRRHTGRQLVDGPKFETGPTTVLTNTMQ